MQIRYNRQLSAIKLFLIYFFLFMFHTGVSKYTGLFLSVADLFPFSMKTIFHEKPDKNIQLFFKQSMLQSALQTTLFIV